MPSFVKQATIVDAYYWNGNWPLLDPEPWVLKALREGRLFVDASPSKYRLGAWTDKGLAWMEAGDWLVTTFTGEIYPVAPIVFASMFVPATSPDAGRPICPKCHSYV